jgi:23S rRNA (adenine2030-N6)-methyltransferase
VRVVEIDGWTGLNAYVPPKERRGLVLIDPPFEKPGEFQRMTEGLVRAHAKWPTGSYALWYPVKDPLETDAFAQSLARTGIPKILRAELFIRRPNDPGRLAGCGMIVVNPPWTLAADLDVLLPWLSDLLRQEDGARSRVGWLTNES